MNFEQMQVVWDAQNERATYHFSEEAVVDTVNQRSRAITSMVSCFEIAMALILTGLALMLVMEPLLDHKEYYQLPHAVLSLGSAAYVWWCRRTRKRTESQFPHNLLGMLDRSIYQLRYKIGLSRSFPYWFIVPMLVGSLLCLPFVYHSKPIWIWPMVVFGMLGCYVPIHREICGKLVPAKKELESLREKLADADEQRRLDQTAE